MTTDSPREALIGLDRPITPPADADERVKARLRSALGRPADTTAPASDDTTDTGTSPDSMPAVKTAAALVDITTGEPPGRADRTRFAAPLLAAAAGLAIVALLFLGNRTDDGDELFVSDPAPSAVVDDLCETAIPPYLASYRAFASVLATLDWGVGDLYPLLAAQRSLAQTIGQRPDLTIEQRRELERIETELDRFDDQTSQPNGLALLGGVNDGLRNLLESDEPPFDCDLPELAWPPSGQ